MKEEHYMDKITSAAAFFRAANGKRVTRTAHGMATLETWPERVEDVKAQLLAQGCAADRITIDEGGIHWPGGYILKPKHGKAVTGLFITRSADYTFTPEGEDRPIYGNKKGATVVGGALIKEIGNGARYEYRIVGEA